VRILGFVALAYALAFAATEWRADYSANLSLEKARAEVARAGRSAEETRRSLHNNPDLLIATASVESSPERVRGDLNQVLPQGVFIAGLKIDYLKDATAHLDFSVVARTADAYDRFLSALSKSPRFQDIKPGSESRPGLVRATVTATHRPGAGRR
jgi:hypothetical protein